ncbi:MAG: glycosyltransferase [Cetobacterium sp.]
MENTILFSLILATINRVYEVDEFLESMLNSKYDLKKIEIIIIDQNKDYKLDKIINKYSSRIKIIHIKSKEIGLSANRNLGLIQSKGNIICFPDDDCKYLPDTLINVEKHFNLGNYDIILGRIIDELGEDCIKKWGKIEEQITCKNFHSKASSITMFIRKKSNFLYEFDSHLGAGKYFGSCEDTDFLYRMIKKKQDIWYFPDIVLYHPKGSNNFNFSKAYKYGLGFGAFCKKNLDINLIKFFILGTGWTFVRFLISIIKLDLIHSKVWIYSFGGRIRGFKEYKKVSMEK